MRILIDSSIIIAGVARPGVCTQLLEELAGSHVWLSSRFILEEVARNLRVKFSIPDQIVAQNILKIERLCVLVEPAAVPPESCRDPDDLLVLGAAVSGQADLIVSVDKDLLVLSSFRGISIVKPGECFRRLRS